MLRNHFTIASRMIRKNKLYSSLNVLGLAVGIACCLLIAIWAQDELSYDKMHVNGDRIYRVNKVYSPSTGGTELHSLTPGPMARTLETDFPEIEVATRMLPAFGDVMLVNGETNLPVKDVLIVDDSFLDVFSFELISGDRKTALTAPLSMILSETTAKTLFGNEDPMGKVITGMGDFAYTVTGIVADAPEHSHLRYNGFISWSSIVGGNGGLDYAWLEGWLPQSIFTYVMLQPGASADNLNEKLPAFVETHFPERADRYKFYLQPLDDIYLNSRDVLHQRAVVLGSGSSVKILSVVGLLILLIACVNFMNLATAQSGRRAMEVGVRKSMGAYRGQLIAQFLSEAFLLVGLSVVAALVIVESVRPAFNALASKQVEAFLWTRPDFLVTIVVLGIIVGFASGLYPAIVLTRFKPARAIKGSGFLGGGDRLRKALVTTQFAASIVLLVGTAIVFRQMSFVQNENPGFDRDHLLIIPTGPTAVRGQIDAFKSEILKDSRVLSATSSSTAPGEGLSSYSIKAEGREEDDGLIVSAIFLGDTDLLDTYGIEMAEGRFFDRGRPADSSAVVVNETMVRNLGWTTAVGKRFDRVGEGTENTIIGVVKDFQTTSMHQAIEPLFMALDDNASILTVRIADDNVAATLDHLHASWKRFEARYPLEYKFIDESFARLYDLDRRLMKVLSVFAAVAILVACLGLFGLATYAAERRMKEVGVRRVLGASVTSVVALLSKDFARLILVAFVIAAPIAYVTMQRWLDGFAYRITIGPGVILLSGAVVLIVALATVSTQAFRAAQSDPVKSLRYE